MFLGLAYLLLREVDTRIDFGSKSHLVMLVENVTLKQSTSIIWIVTSKKIDASRKSRSQSCSIVTDAITAPGGGS